MEIKAPAKINWAIDILGKREDGYHYVDMIMQQIELYDFITLEKGNEIKVSCTNNEVPAGSKNLCYKSAVLYLKKAGIKNGVNIYIEKIIPVAAGLAGGSSDSAAVLKALNMMYEAFSESELLKIGAEIGADVPFCIKGKTMRATNIGDELTNVNAGNVFDIVLVKPPLGVSTKQIYAAYDTIPQKNENKYAQKTAEAIEEGSAEKLALNMGNALEPVTFSLFPKLKKVKSEVLQSGAAAAIMSGSGPTIIGLYKNREDAEKATVYLKTIFKDYFIYKTKTL